MNLVKKRVANTFWETLSCLCTSTYMTWLLCLNSRTLWRLWWSFFFHFSNHFYQISCGKSEGEGAVNTYSFSNKHNTLGLLTAQEQASLRTNWHFPPPTTSSIPALSNSPGSALLFLPTWSSERVCKMLSSPPGSPRQSGSSKLTSTTTKSTVLTPQVFPIPYGTHHHTLPIPLQALLE